MKSWGIAITVLGSATVLLLGFIATQLLQKPATLPEAQAGPVSLPEAPVAPTAADDQLEIQRIELERERLALETLRLEAQIQSDLAQFELALRAQSTDAAEEVAEADDPATDDLADAQPPSMQKFEPDPIAFEEFREPLEPFGDWIESADYGAVWSPNSSDIDDGWAPYTNGSWGYSDYGWSWASSEPFGSVCYHYGRWIRLGGRGWCWVPGRDWAPAWVSWRTCDSHIAWAPLPPSARWNRSLGIGSWVDAYCGIGPTSYCFVERANFGAADCRRVLVDRKNNVDLIRRSKNITRLSRSDRFVHNHGPDFDRACKLSSRPIQRLKIDPTKPEGNRKGIAAGRGAGVKIHAPLKKLDRTKPDRGWGGLAKQNGDLLRLRKQMVAEARGALIGRVKIKPDVIAGAKAPPNRKVIATVEARPKAPSPAKQPQVGNREPAPAKVSPRVNGRSKAVAGIVKTPKAPARAFDPKPTTLPAVERQKSDAAAAQARAQIAQAKQAEERAAAAALAEQGTQRKREQAEAAMLARRKAEAVEQAADERQKVREEQERVASAHAKRDRERKIIAERARKSAEAQREAIARQARAANEEQARRKAEDDARRRKDDQRRKAAAAQEQEDRRRKVEADRKRQEQTARDRKAAEKRRDDERRKARAREDQRRKAVEDSRRKQAADAARAQEAQKQRERQKQVDDARQKQRSSGRSKTKGR